MESMLDKSRLEDIRNKCGFTKGVCFDSNENSEGMGLWWKDLSVITVSFSEHHILVEVREEWRNGRVWFASSIYGWPDRQNKCKTWDLMRNIRATVHGSFSELLG